MSYIQDLEKKFYLIIGGVALAVALIMVNTYNILAIHCFFTSFWSQ